MQREHGGMSEHVGTFVGASVREVFASIALKMQARHDEDRVDAMGEEGGPLVRAFTLDIALWDKPHFGR
jgi:hypothetical protein